MPDAATPLTPKRLAAEQELADVRSGLYMSQIADWTTTMASWEPTHFLSRRAETMIFSKEGVDSKPFTIYPLLDEPGLHCTATIPAEIVSYPIEISINFFGTLDLASQIADLDKGGPGQETLKKHEAALLKQVHSLLNQLSRLYPDAPLTLRIAGHSLGGALAKGFAHTLQRVCALQNNSPEEILAVIDHNITADNLSTRQSFEVNSQGLLQKLRQDASIFKDLPDFQRIGGISVYAAGAPGISFKTDQDATLLTYFQDADFLRVYQQFHAEDIITKFGDCEFLSGSHGIPRIKVNKAIQYQTNITEDKVADQKYVLPFPHITARVMVAHCVGIDKNAPQEIDDLPQCKRITEKFAFSAFRITLYRYLFSLASLLSHWVPALNSYPSQPLPEPKLIKPDNKLATAPNGFFTDHSKVPANFNTNETVGLNL